MIIMYIIVYNNTNFSFRFLEKNNIKLYYIIYFFIFLEKYIDLFYIFVVIMKVCFVIYVKKKNLKHNGWISNYII